jgi:hypothetical protein
MKRHNFAATASLLSGIGTVLLMLIGFCLGVLPFVQTFALLLLPIQLATATVAVGAGIVGYRAAGRAGGAGLGAAFGGLGIGVAWFVLQGLLWGFAAMMYGAAAGAAWLLG